MANWTFIDPDKPEEDEETLDLSDILFPKKEETSIADLTFSFEEEVPAARKVSDPEIQAKAREARKQSTKRLSYDNKIALGWSFLCAHREHLPNLCEREQDRGEFNCKCPCHKERGYVRPNRVSRGSDEEVILLIS